MSVANEHDVLSLQEIWNISWIQEEVHEFIPWITVFVGNKNRLKTLRVIFFFEFND